MKDLYISQVKDSISFINELPDNHYAILQMKKGDQYFLKKFESYKRLTDMGKTPDANDYDVVYLGPCPDLEDHFELLEELYYKFNLDHPDDFTGRSLSVSDIVILNRNGKETCHYVDYIGYVFLPEFNSEKIIDFSVLHDKESLAKLISDAESLKDNTVKEKITEEIER